MSMPVTEEVYQQRSLLARWLFKDVLQRATVVLTGLLLLQFALWIKEEQLWLPGTFTLALYTLLVTGIVELLTKVHRAARVLLQLVILLLMHWIALGVHPIPFSIKEFWGGLAENAAQFFPETGISLAVWASYLCALWWVRTKARIYVLLLVSVVAIAVRDSFSLLVLWDQEAIIIFCGIGLLIARHFMALKQKDPESWTYLSEYPGAVALPVVLLITITAVIGVSAPELPPLVTDPYTAWKQWKGETVTPVGKGFGSFTVAPLDSSSGYSRSDQELGDGFNYDFSPIMTVETTQRSYWRGETKSFYTGRGWEERPIDRQASVRIDGFDTVLAPDPNVNTSKLKTVEVTQTFTMLNDQPYPALFGAYVLQKVTGIVDSDGGNGFPSPSPLTWHRKTATLGWQMRAKPYPKQYTVVSSMPVLDEEGLRTAGTEAYSRPEWREELQLPDTLPARVRQLALDITKDKTNPYDKVKAIEQYLASTYPYNNKPDVSKGKSKDFVDRFLFEIKEGYCDYYSTAMVVLTRSIGIPARWVKGFTTGTLPEEQLETGLPLEELDPSGAGTYTVRNADAHSWAEVYFDGWGWIPFEPTAGFSIPFAEPQEEVNLAPLSETGDLQTSESSYTKRVWPAFGWGLAAALFAACALLVWKLRVLQRLMMWRRGETLNFNERIVFEFDRFLRFCRRKGYVRHEHETARETLQRWMAAGLGVSDDLAALLSVFERAKYGKSPLGEREWQQTADILQKLRSQM